jgi:hypothetical protein
MSWEQSYSVPSFESLLERLTGKTATELLEKELINHGLTITKTEKIVLEDEDLYGSVDGLRVYLSDGRVFEPKLVRRETADGNWGQDVYEYKLQNEEVLVEDVDLSQPYEGYGSGSCSCDHTCGCEPENEGC